MEFILGYLAATVVGTLVLANSHRNQRKIIDEYRRMAEEQQAFIEKQAILLNKCGVWIDRQAKIYDRLVEAK